MEPVRSQHRANHHRANHHRAGPRGVATVVSLTLHGAALAALVTVGAWQGAAPSAEALASAPTLEVTVVMELPVAPPTPASFAPSRPSPPLQPPPRPVAAPVRPKAVKPVAAAAPPSISSPQSAAQSAPAPAQTAAVSSAAPSPPSLSTSSAPDAGVVAASASALAAGPPPVVRTADYLSPPAPPAYPPLARRLGIEGTVVVRALVDRPGQPAEVTVWRSSGESVLDRSALAAVRGWRFRPMTHGGAAIAAWVEIPITFSIANT